MTSKRKILNDPRVESVTNVSIDAFTGETGYEIELKRGYTFDAFADCRIQFENTLREVWHSLDLAQTFDGPYED